jgi:glycerol-3-phosphate acyltransferase PlsY
MKIVISLGVLVLAYLIGSIPFGLLIVKLKTGQDIRLVESGRTGGTNAMRAAGFGAGLLTAILDILKGAISVWLARLLLPGLPIIHVFAPIAAIIGHNYSVFLPEIDKRGHLVRLRGGAGGAPSVGGAFGLWAPSILIIFPLGALFFFTVGIASITTMSVALFALVVFAVRAYMGLNPWSYVIYGVIAELLLVWALRPNLKKLIDGNERIIKLSLHGIIKSKREAQQVNHGNAK